MRRKFMDELEGVRTTLDDLAANFAEPGHQGPEAYASQMHIDHPDVAEPTLRADAVLAVTEFHRSVFSSVSS